MKLSAEVIKSEKEYIARCPELDINCYGYDKKEAIRRLRSVIKFYIASAKELGLEIDELAAISLNGETNFENQIDSNRSSSVN
jgi:predicted RNase H-like HicB family nuclease